MKLFNISDRRLDNLGLQTRLYKDLQFNIAISL